MSEVNRSSLYNPNISVPLVESLIVKIKPSLYPTKPSESKLTSIGNSPEGVLVSKVNPPILEQVQKNGSTARTY